MKRITLLILTAALLAMLLAGCAGTNSASGYRGNVSTTDNGRVNGTNDGMTGTFTGEDGFDRAIDGLEDGVSRGIRRSERSWNDGNQNGSTRRSGDGAVSGDTNTGNPHNAYGEGIYSGRGDQPDGNTGAGGGYGAGSDRNGAGSWNDADNGMQNGRPTPRSGSRPAVR